MKAQENQKMKSEEFIDLSPEGIASYIRIPRVSNFWILLALTCLILGITVWGIVGTIPVTYLTSGYVMDDILYCYVSEQDLESNQIVPGMKVEIEEKNEGTVMEVSPVPVSGSAIYESFDSEYVKQKIKLDNWNYIVKIKSKTKLTDCAMYQVLFDLEDVSPIIYYFG